jgi:hypothetical protein
MVNIEIVNPLEYQGWDDLILSKEDYSFFHTSAWATVITESYGYKPIYVAILDKGRVEAFIPLMEIKSILTGRRGVSLPFSDYCQPLINQETDFLSLIDKLIYHGKRSAWKYIELRGGKAPSGIASSNSYYIHNLKLNRNAEEVFKGFRSSTKRNIKKATKEGVETRVVSSIDSVKEFYRLNCITRKKHGLPPQPYYFFKKIFDHVLSKNAGFVVLASYQKNTIAASIYFHFGKKAIYKYGASNPHYQHLRANNLVMWKAIKWYCENGYKSFCFGRTEPQNKGLLQFKSGWNAEEKILKYYKYDLREVVFVNEDQQKARNFYAIFNKMPIFLLRLIGEVLYPHIG